VNKHKFSSDLAENPKVHYVSILKSMSKLLMHVGLFVEKELLSIYEVDFNKTFFGEQRKQILQRTNEIKKNLKFDLLFSFRFQNTYMCSHWVSRIFLLLSVRILFMSFVHKTKRWSSIQFLKYCVVIARVLLKSTSLYFFFERLDNIFSEDLITQKINPIFFTVPKAYNI
jgi:hypothetical protein